MNEKRFHRYTLKEKIYLMLKMPSTFSYPQSYGIIGRLRKKLNNLIDLNIYIYETYMK